jgi:acyl-CoA synthetase (AMP-forming)/AMP-acid ligase II
MDPLPTLGQVLELNARLFPDKAGASDLERAMTFRQWNARSCRLANALLGMGLVKGDRVAVLAFNCLEWLEIYAATAKAGLIAVPVNFRLVGREIAYVVGNCEAKALFVQSDLAGVVDGVRADLSVPEGNYVYIGDPCPAGYRAFEDVLAAGSDREPGVDVRPDDPWVLMYTSGTTGLPKGALRSHRCSSMQSLCAAVEMGFGRRDGALLVMPLCHANSLYFSGAIAACGADAIVYSRKSFDPEHLVRTLAETGATFTSLVPTHYIMMLGLSAGVRAKYDLDRVEKLLISSAPARQETKRAVMEMFRNSGLYEVYGSTEAGLVTVLHPDEQFTKLGSVGRECVGSRPIRLLDPDGNEVPDGAAGELYSCTPFTFDGYWKMPEKTAEAFRGDYCTVGDLARRDENGFLYLVDRKSNMIISGGENVYPSEVESLLAAHPAVQDVAVIGMPDDKWGERVHAVLVLHPGAQAAEAEILEWCRPRIAGYKRPRSVTFLKEAAMPRTATGKIQHSRLRAMLTGSESVIPR